MNDKPLGLLLRSVKKEHILHSYLFIGTHNLHENATEFAMALNCLDLGQNGPCGECASCIKIKYNSHPDIYTIRPDGSTLKISQVREMQKSLAYKIYEGIYKVIIFEDADKLTIQAANSLLKTLEEPQPQTVFILLAVSQMGIPDTILSRCQKVYFGQETDINSEETVRLMEDLLLGDLEKTINLIEKLEKEDKDLLKQKMEGLMVLVRDMIVLKSTNEETLLNIKELKDSGAAQISLNHEQLVKMLEKLYYGVKNLDKNVNKKMILEDVFFDVKRMIYQSR